MKVVYEQIKVEYESKEKRRKHIKEMEEEGYKVLKETVELDFVAHEHIFAEYIIKRDGYKGHPISKGSIK